MLFTDGLEIANTRQTKRGYMLVDAQFARTGIQIYSGAELDRPDLQTARIYRPEVEVFSDKAMGSFAHQPVTVDHPPRAVDAENWKDHAVGMTGDTVVRDGEHVRIAFTLMDASAIQAVKDGKRELSAGYSADIDWTPGTTPEGEVYDGAMRNLLGNHLAIVSRGRAGATCRIGDSWETIPRKEPAMADTTRAVIVDGVSYNLSDQGAQLVEKLSRDLADAQGRVTARDGQIAELTSAQATAVQAKDSELAALRSAHDGAVAIKDAEIERLKALSDEATIDARADAKQQVITFARALLGDSFDPKGQSIEQIKAAVVTKRIGDAAANGRDAAFFSAAYETIVLQDAANPPADPVREVFRDGVRLPGAVNDSEPTYEQRMAARWKGSK